MQLEFNPDDLNPDELRRAVAEIFAKGIIRWHKIKTQTQAPQSTTEDDLRGDCPTKDCDLRGPAPTSATAED